MSKIITGNLDTEVASHPETKGWFLGCFMEKNPDFLSDHVEVKWGRHPKGEIRKGYDAEVPTKTLVILISGSCVVRFPKLEKKPCFQNWVTMCFLMQAPQIMRTKQKKTHSYW